MQLTLWYNKNRRAQTAEDQEKVLLFEATRVEDVRLYYKYSPCVATYWGTGGSRVPYVYKMQERGESVAYSIREDAKANNFSATEIDNARALQALQPSVQSHHAQTFIAEQKAVRRLTPTECERLQGFPDDWTQTQSDSQRYKQMGNAVTVNVIEWIGSRL